MCETIRCKNIDKIIDKIFERNSSFYVKYGKISSTILLQFFSTIDEIFVLDGRLGLIYNSITFLGIRDLS